MPTYQYSCTECGHFFEQFQSFSEDSLTVCPQCEGRLRKVFNAVGVVFKGSGFYRTDSRSSGSADATAGDGAAGGSATGSGESGTKGASTETAASTSGAGGSTGGASSASPTPASSKAGSAA